jgi:hypothetical protein
MAALLIAQNGIGNLSAGDALGNLPRDLTEPQSLEAVEFATLEWVDWFNNRRLLEPIGGIPPAEAEARYYAQLEHTAMAAWVKPINLRKTRCGSMILLYQRRLSMFALAASSLAIPLPMARCWAAAASSPGAWGGVRLCDWAYLPLRHLRRFRLNRHPGPLNAATSH